MQHRHYEPHVWHFVPVKPGAEARSRQWNFVIITFLAALVVGLLLSAL